MKVNIVTYKHEMKWVLGMICKYYAKYIPNSKISFKADPNADINIYINHYLFKKKTTIDVGFFTHREHDNPELSALFDNVANQVDWCVAMSEKTAEHLPKDKTTVVHVAPPQKFNKKKIVFGVVGREYASGRKRFEWIDELRKIDRNKIEIKITNGKVPDWRMPNFYRSIDYLLILSKNEGGPLPLLEALAMGKPVISTDVGFVNDYTTIRYSTLDELKHIIKGLIIPDNAWELSAKKLITIFDNLLEKKK